jgi:sRNA-binding carbon storage regulator CsrA
MAFDDDDRYQYIVIICTTFVGFAALFCCGWAVSERYVEVFGRLAREMKADWCSRIISTVHAIIVTVGFVATLAQVEWNPRFHPYYSQDLVNVRSFMSVSLGYFAFDFLVVAGFRVPLYPVFLAHHVIASLPFYLYLFVNGCDVGTLSFGAFLIVELATIFMNLQTWCETVVGHKNTTLYRVLFGLTYVSWFLSRLVMPVWVMAFWYMYVLLEDQDHPNASWGCLVPMTICGHIIIVFCYVVFLGVLTPELVQILKGEVPKSVQQEEEQAAALEEAERRPDHEAAAVHLPPSEAAPSPDDGLPPALHHAHLSMHLHELQEEAPALRASIAAHGG